MKMPDERSTIELPDLSGVPDVGRIEAACRRAGAIPRSDTVNRARAHQSVIEMIDRYGEADITDVAAVNANVDAITKYHRGGFDRRQSDGRPIDEVQLERMQDAVEQVQRIRTEEGCSRDEAIWRLLERRGYGGRRDLFLRIRNDMRR